MTPISYPNRQAVRLASMPNPSAIRHSEFERIRRFEGALRQIFQASLRDTLDMTSPRSAHVMIRHKNLLST